jgi:hypothetical protein
MLRDDQIVEILELVDFRITKSDYAFFRDENMKIIWNVATKCCVLNALVFIYEEQKKIQKPH